MYDTRVYWLWLHHAFGAGSNKPLSIFRRFNSLQEFYEGGRKLWSQFDFISEKNLFTLESYTLEKAQAQLEFCTKLDQEVYCYECFDYPEKLKNIDTPPSVFFAKGTLPDFDNVLTITVVGSRKTSKDIIELTQNFCYELSKNGAIIVSGGAIGIDSAAHTGSLRATGVNACVLPCGLDSPYLMENMAMRQQIVYKGGCMISEYPSNTPVYKGAFQVRNRLMSALGNGLLVMRAAKRSGTMITVAHATNQNKDIFAVPGNISDPTAKGTNELIRDGAVPVLAVRDILDAYPNYQKIKTKTFDTMSDTIRKDCTILSPNALEVYKFMSINPTHISKLCEFTKLKTSQVQAAITELEMLDYIDTFAGQRCSLKKN
ncbi:MAG: DNA-processing protein DprA [Clostridia bacterium]